MVRSCPTVYPLLPALLVLSACPDDDGAGIETLTDGSGTDTETTDTTDTDGATVTTSTSTGDIDETTGGVEPVAACDSVDIPAPGSFGVVVEDLVVIDVAAELASPMPFYCSQAGIVAPGPSNTQLTPADDLGVVVYRPDDNGSWPNGPLPSVILMPGNGQFTFAADGTYGDGDAIAPTDRYYDRIIEPLVERGFVVFAAQPAAPNMNEERRRAQMLCTAIWAQNPNGWAEASSGRLDDTLALIGHSRGGGAAYFATADFGLFQDAIDEMAEFELCATVAIAPRWGASTILGGGPPINEPIELEESVPYLVLTGAIDDDVRGSPVSAYDAFVLEDPIDADDSSTLSEDDKVVAWVYGVQHNAWGGVTRGLGPLSTGGRDIADAVGPEVVARFLGWQLSSTNPATERDFFRRLADPSTTSTGVPTIDDATLWDTLDFDNDEFYADHGRPLIYVGMSEGSRPPEDTADGRPDRLIVDTLSRFDSMGELSDLGNGAGQASDFLSPGPNDRVGNLDTVEIDGVPVASVWHGAAESVTTPR